ncbi:uncharacterized protein LOC121325800 [Polyodon spathula]|uniref:uncharacterized protein LOC121325800 n=1 Tax=Polyodon spathula TaxID=7913 RepID=UPI001B7EBFB2|nr:uncharacterized protein LOC121325800 [Polyodon spathula]
MSDKESVSSGSSTSSQNSRSSNSRASSEDTTAEKQRKVLPEISRELSGNEERKKHPTKSNPTPDNSIKADPNQGNKTQSQNSKEPSSTQLGNKKEETAEKKKPLTPSGEKEHSHGNIVKETISDKPEKDSIIDEEGSEPKRQPPKQAKRAPSQVKYKTRNQLLEEELSRIKARMNMTCSANLLKRPQRKLYHPFVWNSLHPYSDTHAIDYLLHLPDSGHYSCRARLTSSRIVDSETSCRSDKR